jgi:NTE family protein
MAGRKKSAPGNTSSTGTPAGTQAGTAPDTGSRLVNLALQGGGAHGAFGWGVLDCLLEDGRIDIEAISGTSAGSMNAVVLAYGLIDGKSAARDALHRFWMATAEAGRRYSPLKLFPWEKLMYGHKVENAIASHVFKAVTQHFSPYQLNPGNFNPLREVLEQVVDFDRLARSSPVKLFLAATNVRTGKVKVFGGDEALTADMVMASACLPQLFQAVEVAGEHYWDGGWMGNPVLYPLFYETRSRDVVIVHINPIERAGPPTTAEDIMNRVNEISFNASLIKELRAVHFVQKLMDEGWIKDEYMGRLKYVLMHSIRSDAAMSDLSVATKLSSDWDFLTLLRDRGRAFAHQWLADHFQHLGVRSSVDLKKEFLS